MKNVLVFCLSASLLSPCIQAQHKKEYTNFADTTFSINEVIVNKKRLPKVEALKLNVPMEYIPISTNTLPGSILQVRNINEIQDAVRLLPGVKMGTDMFKSIKIRGLADSPYMIDGIRDERQTASASPIGDLSEMESVELLKGPEAIITGSNAIGGALNLVRKAPVDHQLVMAKLSYGSWNVRQATLDLGGRLAGPVTYRANINYLDGDGWRNNLNKRASGFLALNIKTSGKSELDLRGSVHRDDYGVDYGIAPLMPADVYNLDGSLFLKNGEMQPGIPKDADYKNPSDYLIDQSWDISAKYKYAFSNHLRLTNHLSYYNDATKYLGTEYYGYLTSNNPVYDKYYVKNGQKKYINTDTLNRNSGMKVDYMAQVVNEHLDLTGDFTIGEVKNNFQLGYSFIMMNRDYYEGFDMTGPGAYQHLSVFNPQPDLGAFDAEFTTVFVTKHRTHAIYLQDLVELNEHFKVLLSGRYDFFKYMSTYANPVEGKYEYTKTEPYSTLDYSKFTYRVGLVYLPNPSLSLFGSMSSFFKPNLDGVYDGYIYINSDGKEFDRTAENFKPESGYQAEVGARYNIFDKLQLNTSIFYIVRNNIVKELGSAEITDPATGETTKKYVTGQVAKMDSKGFDVELKYDPLPELSMTAGYSYTDARTRKLSSNAYFEKESTEGLHLNNTPVSQFYAYGSYTLLKGPLKNIGFDATASFVGKSYMDILTDLYYDPYWVVDLGVHYNIPQSHLRLQLFANNVLNTTYYQSSWSRQLVQSKPANFTFSVIYNL